MFSKLKIYNQSSRFQIADNQATENEIDSHEEAENETVSVILEATLRTVRFGRARIVRTRSIPTNNTVWLSIEFKFGPNIRPRMCWALAGLR